MPIKRNDAPARQAGTPGWPSAVFYALATVAACTAVSETLRGVFDPANLIMVYLAGVVVVALRSGRRASLLAVAGSILVFDLMFVPPRWSFNPIDTQYFFTFTVMLIVGLLISHLVTRAAQQTVVAEARARRALALNELARQLASATSTDAVALGLHSSIGKTFGCASALLLPDAQGRLHDAGGFCRADAGELAPAQRAFDSGQDSDATAPTRAGAHDGGPSIPHRPALYLPLLASGHAVAVLGIRDWANAGAAPEERDLLSAFANQAALALARAASEQKSAQTMIEIETERLRNTLLSGISHDFRTPLTTIIGSVTSLLQQDHALDRGQRSMLLHDILGEARRMHRLMSDLLDLMRMEEGAVHPSFEWCPADELVEEVRASLQQRLLAHDLRVQISPDTIVWCDPRLVEQLLVNLLDNAARHTPAGTLITLSVKNHGDHWSMVLADNGPGLSPGQEREVFKKFVRGHGEPARTGTGLGLAICAAVARLHGGEIAALSDGGARFTLTIPQPGAATPEPPEGT
jgi:two-component system sensor histidine kinase KdpD